VIIPRKPSDAQYVKALIHGPAGSGKTRFCGTAQLDERTYPTAFLNFESGDQTLSGLDIDVFDIVDFSTYDDVYKILSDPKTKYKSACIDSLTETQVVGLLNILDLDKKRADPDLLAMQDWGLILTRMRRFVRQFKFLPLHTFFTALSKDEVVARVGNVKSPALQGAFATEMPGIMDIVAYMAQEEQDGVVKRLLLLHSYPRFSVKCRAPWDAEVPAEIYDPTVSLLLDALNIR